MNNDNHNQKYDLTSSDHGDRMNDRGSHVVSEKRQKKLRSFVNFFCNPFKVIDSCQSNRDIRT